jgi:hypothetical protein
MNAHSFAVDIANPVCDPRPITVRHGYVYASPN